MPSEQIAGSGWHAATHPDDLERHNAKWLACAASGEPLEDEVRFRRADGTVSLAFAAWCSPARRGRSHREMVWSPHGHRGPEAGGRQDPRPRDRTAADVGPRAADHRGVLGPSANVSMPTAWRSPTTASPSRNGAREALDPRCIRTTSIASRRSSIVPWRTPPLTSWRCGYGKGDGTLSLVSGFGTIRSTTTRGS